MIRRRRVALNANTELPFGSLLNKAEVSPPAAWYLASVATFMVPAGIQMVLLPYLLTIELKREIPEEKKARAIRIEADAAPRTITQQ